jgi:translation initiation factor IF-2
MEEIGPVDYAITAFPGSRFRGEIAPAIGELVESGMIRVIDIAFVGKDSAGEAAALELTELDPDVREALESVGVQVGGLFNEDDVMAAAEELEPDSSAALIVWENVWARKVAQAVRNAGGVVLDFDRLPDDVVHAAREWALEPAKA